MNCWRHSSVISSRSMPRIRRFKSWDIYACVRQVLDVLDPVDELLPKSFVQRRHLISEDEALRAIHLAENESERERARQRLTTMKRSGCNGHWWHAETMNSANQARPRRRGTTGSSRRSPSSCRSG